MSALLLLNRNRSCTFMLFMALKICTPISLKIKLYIIVLNSNLKFHGHIATEINKAARTLGLVKKTFTCLDEIAVPRLNNEKVRPHWDTAMLSAHQDTQPTPWRKKYSVTRNKISVPSPISPI